MATISPTDLPEGLELRPIKDDEWVAFVRAGELPFHAEPREPDFEIFKVGLPLERSLAVFDGDTIVGNGAAFDFRMTVPGGREVATAGVTAIAVSPTHRRRGLLTAIMRRQLTDYHEWGVPLAALWASESGIYGRFGYGLASWCVAVSVSTRWSAFAPAAPKASGRIRLVDSQSAAAREAVVGVDEATRHARPGRYARDLEWMGRTLADPEHWRDGAGPLQLAVHDGPEGVDGFLLYSVKRGWEQSLPAGELVVHELEATTIEAYAALWRYALDVDLVDRVTARALPLDTPLLGLLADPRRARPTMRDNLYVRLVDLPAALGARTYSRPVDVVLDVRDPFCPWNERRWRLSGDDAGGTCTPTTGAPDLTVTSAALAAAYLGGPPLRSMVATGQVSESRPGALAAASAALHCDVAPCCPEVF